MKINPMLMTDFYKISHRIMSEKGTEKIYSTFTPRSSRIKGINEVVFFGLQGFIKEYLVDYFNEHFFHKNKEAVIADYKRMITYTLGEHCADTKHIEDLHDLGFLPIKIKAVKEGSVIPIKVPVFTIENTHKEFYWLTNFLETLISTSMWKVITATTISKQYKDICDKWAGKTCDSNAHVQWQCHNFSYRGMSSNEDAITSGAGHLAYFTGTDTIPSIQYLENYYNANIKNELIASSVLATEHSIQCQYQDDLKYYKRMLEEVAPRGIISIVSDGYDYWNVIENIIPSLKDTIMNRNGKLVVRPDCYDDQTEILTNNGWKLFKNLDKDIDEVAQFDNGNIEFVKPLKYIEQSYQGEMVKFSSKKNKIDLIVTPNHRMIRYNKNKNMYEAIEASKIKYFSDMNLPVAGLKQGIINELTAYEKLLIAFQADGRCRIAEDRDYGILGGSYILEFAFAKQRKIDKLQKICEEGGFRYKIIDQKSRKWQNENWKDQVSFYVYMPIKPMKSLKEWVNIHDKSYLWCREFIDEVSNWDATLRDNNRVKYDCVISENVEIVQMVAMLAGYRTTLSESEDNRSEKFSNVHTVHIVPNTNVVGGQVLKKESITYEGIVYCVTVPSGMLVIRRNGQIVISGNSGNPTNVICGDTVIADLTNDKDIKILDDCEEYMKCEMVDAVRGETPHGEYGQDKITSIFKFNGKHYELKVEIEWNRYDKQYYYIDGSHIISCEEVQLTLEQKGSIEALWDIFGGTINSKGYKVLDSHIGLIYGDAITPERAEEIFTLLEQKGFSSENIVYGVGSYSLGYHSRDSLGIALKATYTVVNGKEINIFKDPATDKDKLKKSQKGMLVVFKKDGVITYQDELNQAQRESMKDIDLLEDVFIDGRLIRDETLAEIRAKVNCL